MDNAKIPHQGIKRFCPFIVLCVLVKLANSYKKHVKKTKICPFVDKHNRPGKSVKSDSERYTEPSDDTLSFTHTC